MISIFMLWGAVNYSNNAAYFVFFMLISLSLVSGLYGFKNLMSLDVRLNGKAYAFAGSELRLKISMVNNSSDPKESLQCFFRDLSVHDKYRFIAEVAPNENFIHEMALPVHERGALYLDQIYVCSFYPLGFFSFEKNYSVNLECLIYPKPEGQWPWPEEISNIEDDEDEWSHLPGDSFAGHRPYVLGESQRHIDWKAFSRGKGLLIKDYRGGAKGSLCFDFNKLGHLDIEARLSQLACWAVDAKQDHIEFSVCLPEQYFPAGRGESHYRSIMKALALYPKFKSK
ncbi:MAG: DUF58 domain-containing protein [Verrucomicrobiota bacterium]